jgi:3-oxoacyl-[acyl-carrier protein] reductase
VALLAIESRVVFTYRRDGQAAAALVEAVAASGGEAFAVRADFGRSGEATRVVDKVLTDFDGLSMIVGNAGIASRDESAARTTEAEYLSVCSRCLPWPMSSWCGRLCRRFGSAEERSSSSPAL